MTYNETTARRLAAELASVSDLTLVATCRAASEQLVAGAGAEEIERLNAIIYTWEGLAEGYLDRVFVAESDRDRLAARCAELEKLCGEACDIADANIFAPTISTTCAAAPGANLFTTAQPMNFMAAAPVQLGQTFTIDTGKSYRDKARITEIRAALAKERERDEARAECERMRRDRDSYANSDFERQLDDERTLIARIEEWTHVFGAVLKPRGADTYGEGMRDAKAQVSLILRRDPHALAVP